MLLLALAAWPLLPLYLSAWQELPWVGTRQLPRWALLPDGLMVGVDLLLLLMAAAQAAMLWLSGAMFAGRACRGRWAVLLHVAVVPGTVVALVLAWVLMADRPFTADSIPCIAALLACGGAGMALLLDAWRGHVRSQRHAAGAR